MISVVKQRAITADTGTDTPAPVIDALVGAFKLTGQDVSVDLGCGTGQLTPPMAGRVRTVIGMDVRSTRFHLPSH